MAVSREAVDALAKTNEKIIQMAQKEILYICAILPQGMTNNEVLDLAKTVVMNAYPAIAAQYGGAISYAAVDFYNKERRSWSKGRDVASFEASLVSAEDTQILESDVRYRAKDLYNDKNAEFASGLATSMETRLRRHSDRTLIQNAYKDPAKPKIAIVPHVGACGYCVMLGGLGFHYLSESTANMARHHKCKCSLVMDFDTKNPSLEGYEPSKYADAYNNAKMRIENDALDKWNNMSKSEQEAYRDRMKRNSRSQNKGFSINRAREHFIQRATVDELSKHS